jgi:hypothetical protein
LVALGAPLGRAAFNHASALLKQSETGYLLYPRTGVCAPAQAESGAPARRNCIYAPLLDPAGAHREGRHAADVGADLERRTSNIAWPTAHPAAAPTSGH